MNRKIISKIEEFVKNEMEALCAAHDFAHIQRVVFNAKKIYEEEKQGDLLVIEAGALLHESFDEKFFSESSMSEKKEQIIKFLGNTGMNQSQIQGVIFVMENVGYGKSLERGDDFQGTIEFQIVEDADRLESIGAIAIARCFTYGGKKGREIYNPNIKPLDLTNKKEYHSDHKSTSFNHFYEKLLLLKDLMHTETGKKFANSRHEFMQKFMKEFLAEWNGKK